MATLRQILANRRNCRSSCGARTPEGRAASARNSTVHGLTATTMPHEDELPLIEKCREEWLPELRPEGVNQTWWADRVIAATARILWAEQQEDAWRFRKAERARLNWSGDRALEIAQLANGLAKSPDVVGLKLRQSLHGAIWLSRQLGVLAGLLERSASNENQASQEGALPDGLDEANRAWACDLLGLSYEERQGPTRLDLPAGSTLTTREHQAAVIRAEIAVLEQRIENVLAELDETDQTAAMLDRGPGVDSTIRLYHRYRKDAERARAEALAALRQAQREAAAAKKAEEKAKPVSGFEAVLRLMRIPRAKTRDVPRRAPEGQAEVVAKATTVEQPLRQPAPVVAPAAAAEPEVVIVPAPVSADASLVAPVAPQAPVAAAEVLTSPASPTVRPPGLAAMIAPPAPRNRRERRALARAAHRSIKK